MLPVADGRKGVLVDRLNFITNTGRTLVAGGSGGSAFFATPCPIGSYVLAGVKGSSGVYLEQITLVWKPVAAGSVSIPDDLKANLTATICSK